MTTRSLASLLLSLLLLAGPATAVGAVDDGTFVPGQVLVKFKPGAATSARRAALARRDHAPVGEMLAPDLVLVGLLAGQSVETAVAAYRDDPTVEYAQPNYVYRALARPNDPDYGQVWGLRNTGQTITAGLTQPPGSPLGYVRNNPGTPGMDINAEAAWNAVTDCSSVVVAVLDSGVNYTHEDLAANMWTSATYPKHGWNFVDGNDDPMDLNGHGTHVAGTIGAVGNNGKGVAGVCWAASLMAVRVLDATNEGQTAGIINGIYWAVARGAKVLNMSLGGEHPFDQAYADAIQRAQDADVVVVVAAGNSAKDNDVTNVWPCNLDNPNLVCVAALDQGYALATFSNWGATKVMVGAPGTNVVSTWPGTNARITDGLSSGWTRTPEAGGWDHSTLTIDGVATACLVDPVSFPDGTYAPNTDARAYKAFPVGAANAVVLRFRGGGDVASGDHFRIAYKAGATSDPFTGGTIVASATAFSTFPKLIGSAFDVSPCRNSTCSVGFQLESGASGGARGFAIANFSLTTLVLNGTSYATDDGTSMAAPAVAGVVAMLRARNPRFTHADVVTAIGAGGRTVPSLAGKTRTGKAVDAIGSLSYIQPPTGVAAVVQ